MGSLSWYHWLIVLAVVVLLFGSKKLPEAARGLGRSMRIFKSEMTEMQNDGKPAAEQQPQAIDPATQAYSVPPQQQPYPHPQAATGQAQPAPHPQAHPQAQPHAGQAEPPQQQYYIPPSQSGPQPPATGQ